MIALPVTAQSAEPPTDTMSPQDMPPQREASTNPPFPSPRSNRDANYTPSISPLSTTSRAHNDYFTQSNPPRASHTPAPNAIEHSLAHTNQQDTDVIMRDDRSSSLSDYDANSENQENDNAASPRSPLPIEEADSEAETERLGRTPQKPWNNPDTGRTPSKLNQETSIDNPLSDPPASSPTTPGRDAQSPTPTRRLLASPSTIAGQKRKRSPPPSEPDSPLSEAASDSDEILHPIRPNGSALPTKATTEKDPSEELVDDQRDDGNMPESARDTPEPDDVDENPYISPMKAARLKGKKQKAKRQKEPATIQRPEYEAEYEDTGEPDDLQEDDDGGAKSEEDRETKRQARASYDNLVSNFQILVAKLHREKLAAAEAELEQLTSLQPTHAEYLAQLKCISQRRDTKISQEYTLAYYKRQALCNQTLAERAQLHTQYYQESREIRGDLLDDLGKAWYDIQKERRQFQADQADKYTYKYTTKLSEQIRNQANYNKEVSIISGIQHYIGFPAAPEIHGSRPSELDDDLKAMKIPRQQPQLLQQPPVYQDPKEANGMPARTAQEKWVEQNPWANAQHPSHQQTRTPVPFPAFAPYHNPPTNPSVNLFRHDLTQRHATNSPFSTPLHHGQRRPCNQANGLGSSDTIGVPSDPPSSAQAAPQTTDKTQPGPGVEDGSPLDSFKARVAMHNPLSNRDDRRNFSNLSSASTIDAPNDHGGENADRQQHQHLPHPYAGLTHAPMPPSLPVEPSAAQQGFFTSALHAQHGRPEDRKPPELYESVNFRPPMGTYGTPMPLFGGGSPARQEGQRAT